MKCYTVKTGNGTPRTKFKPSAGAAYFIKQAGKIIVPAIILLSPQPVE